MAMTLNNSRSRLTAFAIIHSLEADTRHLIHLGASQSKFLESLSKEQRQSLSAKAEADLGSREVPPLDLVQYADFRECLDILRRVNKGVPKTDPILRFCTEVDGLVGTRNRVMHGRPLEADDLSKCYSAMVAILTHDGLDLPHLFDARSKLDADPNFVLNLQIPTNEDRVLHNLPQPDFDDTGLIGREAESIELLRLFQSNKPVISVIGEGGVGKSSIVISTLYSLLDRLSDSSTPQFEAIVWVSLKTKSLSASGVRDIQNAIDNALGAFNHVQAAMGVPISESIDRIIEFMDSFPVLLVLDNLETVNAGAIRDFLSQIPTKSKIIVTSRIGIGEFEQRYLLAPLKSSAASRLIRKAAVNLNVRQLSEASAENIEHYGKSLFFNPLAIKWFVGSVANGASPKALAKKPDELLEFCFESIFATFDADTKTFLQILLASRRPLTMAEIDYFAERYKLDYMAILNGLLATSMVFRTKDEAYFLTDFAAEYLRRFHPASSESYRQFLVLDEELRQVQQDGLKATNSEYDPVALRPDPQNKSQVISASYLKDALSLTMKLKNSDAKTRLDRARMVAPDYIDVFLIAGYIYGTNGNVVDAEDEFEQALDTQPNNPRILNAYATFLLNHLRLRFDVALELTERAVAIEDCPFTRLTRGRSKMMLARYKQAIEDFEFIISDNRSQFRQQILAFNLILQCYRGLGDFEASQGNPEAIDWYAQGYRVAKDAFSRNVYDQQIATKAVELIGCAFIKEAVIRSPQNFDHFVALITDKHDLLKYADPSHVHRVFLQVSAVIAGNLALRSKLQASIEDVFSFTSSSNLKRYGTVSRIEILDPGGYGFISSDNGESYYFNNFDLKNARLSNLSIGSLVSFEPSLNEPEGETRGRKPRVKAVFLQ